MSVGVYFRYLIVPALFLISFPSISDEVDEQVRVVMGWLDSADAESDARDSLKRGDMRLWGVRGIMLYIPGVENLEKEVVQNLPIVKKHGYRILRGSSDYRISAEHQRLVKLAHVYARKYNEYVLSAEVETTQ